MQLVQLAGWCWWAGLVAGLVASWTGLDFGTGSSLVVVGPARSRVIPCLPFAKSVESFRMMVATCAWCPRLWLAAPRLGGAHHHVLMPMQLHACILLGEAGSGCDAIPMHTWHDHNHDYDHDDDDEDDVGEGARASARGCQIAIISGRKGRKAMRLSRAGRPCKAAPCQARPGGPARPGPGLH